MYGIYKGTVGKLITIKPGKDAEVQEWTIRKDLKFTECLIDPRQHLVVQQMADVKKPLAVRMAEDGYYLFGGETGGDRSAVYVIAVPYSQVVTE